MPRARASSGRASSWQRPRHADLTLGDLETHLGEWSPAAGALVRPTLERIAAAVERVGDPVTR